MNWCVILFLGGLFFLVDRMFVLVFGEGLFRISKRTTDHAVCWKRGIQPVSFASFLRWLLSMGWYRWVGLRFLQCSAFQEYKYSIFKNFCSFFEPSKIPKLNLSIFGVFCFPFSDLVLSVFFSHGESNWINSKRCCQVAALKKVHRWSIFPSSLEKSISAKKSIVFLLNKKVFQRRLFFFHCVTQQTPAFFLIFQFSDIPYCLNAV